MVGDRESHQKLLDLQWGYSPMILELLIQGSLIIGNQRSMKLTRFVKIRVNLSRINFVER